MRLIGIAMLLAASFCYGQEQGDAKRVHLLWIGVGTNEPERMKSGLESLHTSLDAGGVKHVFYESPGTDHEWQTWRRDLKDFAPRLFQYAAASQ